MVRSRSLRGAGMHAANLSSMLAAAARLNKVQRRTSSDDEGVFLRAHFSRRSKEARQGDQGEGIQQLQPCSHGAGVRKSHSYCWEIYCLRIHKRFEGPVVAARGADFRFGRGMNGTS